MSEYQHHFDAPLSDGTREQTAEELALVSGGVIAPSKPDGGRSIGQVVRGVWTIAGAPASERSAPDNDISTFV
jgi:hypothetical protein